METVAQRLGKRLREVGVRYAFGHPGGEVTDLIEGLRREGIQFILTRHETSGVIMAEAIGATTGIPGVAIGTLGPGATNMVTGVAHAYLDRSPLIAMTAQLPDDRYPMVTHQKLDLLALYAPITKWASSMTPLNAEAVLAKAVRVATAERPGPVYLQVPADVAGQPAVDAPFDRFHTETVQATGFDPAALESAARRLRSASRPLILAGTDALRGKASAAVRALAEATGVPVMVGPKAKGVFPEDHPLFIGTVEMLGFRYLFDVIDTCDVVVMAGFDAVELDADWKAKSAIIHFGALANDELYFPSQIDVVGPVAPALEAFRSAVGPMRGWDPPEVQRVKADFHRFLHPDLPGLLPQRVLEVLREVSPRSLMLSCDTGSNKAVTGQMWRALEPNAFLMSNGISTMGYGLPAAMGMKLAHPDRPVATVVGDGGLGMCLGELETVARLKMDITVIVLVDEALDMITRNQERKGYATLSTEITSPDYVGLAKAFGGWGVEADSPESLQKALSESLRRPGLNLVAARINRQAYKL